jgi:4-amino-4-deoxy-L-arabinose transferase-like glycosyltransferase
MTITSRTARTSGIPTDPLRRTAFVAGALYLATFAASIPARFYFLDPVLSDPEYVLGPGGDTRVVVGGVLDMVNALACIGTAVVLFTVVRRQNETLALGFVTSRVLEAAIISVGVVSLLAVVTLQQDTTGTAGAEEATLVTVGASLVAVYGWTFLFGPNVMAAVNALLLGSLLYRSGLVPRAIPLVGLIGGPLLLASVTGIVFGTHDLDSGLHVIAAAPIFCWELSLGVWLVVKGFRPSPVTTGAVPSGERPADLSRA